MFENNRIKSQTVPIGHMDYIIYKDQSELLRPIFKNKFQNVLDYGSGNSPYRELVVCDNFFAADITQNINQSVDIIINPDSTLPNIGNGIFDLVLIMDVLEHIPNDQLAMMELSRVIQAGGILVVTVPFIYREHEYPNDYRRYTTKGVEKLLKDNGFDILSMNKIGNIWYVLFATWFKSRVLNGEVDGRSFFGKVVRKIASYSVIPLLNLTLFKRGIEKNSGVYGRLLITSKKRT